MGRLWLSTTAALLLLLLLLLGCQQGVRKGVSAIRVRGLAQGHHQEHHLANPHTHKSGDRIPRAAPDEWVADPGKGAMLSLLLPVFPDNETLALLANQLRTYARYFDSSSILEWVFVTPQSQLEKLVYYLENWLNKLPEIPGDLIKVVTDEDCAPELSEAGLLALNNATGQWLAGWDKQQVLKLACSWVIKTPYYLILDADVFFLEPLNSSILLEAHPRNASQMSEPCPVCDLKKETQYLALNEIIWTDHQEHPEWSAKRRAQEGWMARSGATLGLTPDEIFNISYQFHMGITPQTLATPVVLAMGEYIEANLSRDHGAPHGRDNWRQYLLRRMLDNLALGENKSAWTEYELYWMYSHHTGYWDTYHRQGCFYRAPATVWGPEQWADWDPCRKILPPYWNEGWTGYPGYWAVVQSTTHASAEQIWEKIEKCMEQERLAALAALSGGQTNATASAPAVQ